ncbi:uncharacterized protein C2845_PM02G16410 [Panicum miliaceum]|uniref:Uncharacterized protein n=1 Tax=Panicum miliaceum TaxID=4540 RepID=A0A3L6S6F8_PANMI|nr:uncharacterized protein C2845_PM02G16410 [Panicum miliaceum]
MASFNFTSVVLDEGTIFTFGSWVCVANGSGGFNNHLANPKNRRHLLRHPAVGDGTLQRINPREPKAFDHDFGDFIGKPKTPRPSTIRSEVFLPKTLCIGRGLRSPTATRRRRSYGTSRGYRLRQPFGFGYSCNTYNRQPPESGKRINSDQIGEQQLVEVVDELIEHDAIFLFLTKTENLHVVVLVQNHDGGFDVEWNSWLFHDPGGRVDEQLVRARYLIVSSGELLMVVRIKPHPTWTSAFKVFA